MLVYPEQYHDKVREMFKLRSKRVSEEDLHRLAVKIAERVTAALAPIKRKMKESLDKVQERERAAQLQAEEQLFVELGRAIDQHVPGSLAIGASSPPSAPPVG